MGGGLVSFVSAVPVVSEATASDLAKIGSTISLAMIGGNGGASTKPGVAGGAGGQAGNGGPSGSVFGQPGAHGRDA
jgi:hypothetical protein